MSDLDNNDCANEALGLITKNDGLIPVYSNFLEPVKHSQSKQSTAEVNEDKYGITVPLNLIEKAFPATNWPDIS